MVGEFRMCFGGSSEPPSFAARIAAPNAKLAIVDWSPEAEAPPGPPLAHRLARSAVERTLEEGGWAVVKSDVVSEWTYIVVGQR